MQTSKISRVRKQRFLAALARDGNVPGAAEEAQVDEARLDAARRMDPSFASEWEAAERTAARKLVQEAYRRAIDGVPEPVISEGKVVRDDDGRPLSVRRYSDSLLIEMLRLNQFGRFDAKKFGMSPRASQLIKWRWAVFLLPVIALATGSLALWWFHDLSSIVSFHRNP